MRCHKGFKKQLHLIKERQKYRFFNLQVFPFHFVWFDECLDMFSKFFCFSQDQNTSIFFFQTMAKMQLRTCLHAISYLCQQRQTFNNAVSDAIYIYENKARKLQIMLVYPMTCLLQSCKTHIMYIMTFFKPLVVFSHFRLLPFFFINISYVIRMVWNI